MCLCILCLALDDDDCEILDLIARTGDLSLPQPLTGSTASYPQARVHTLEGRFFFFFFFFKFINVALLLFVTSSFLVMLAMITKQAAMHRLNFEMIPIPGSDIQDY